MSQHPNDDPERPFFATAAKGTEGVLRDELKELGLPRVKASRGGVHFGGERASAMRACLHSRVAMRVLERQAGFDARNADELYAGVHAVEWERVLDAQRTLCVDAQVRSATISNSAFAAQRVKDAIVDRLRERFGARPSVNKRDPDVRVALHLVGERASVALDVSGESLHARGYRARAGEAPLRETLAAAIIRLSRWDRALPLIDPLCGAGTLAIEAAQLAAGIAPGIARERFGFERWADYDASARGCISELREQARAGVRDARDRPPVFASDVDAELIATARENAQRAGVRLELARADARAIVKQHASAVLVTNPPYGERLARNAQLEREIAQAFRRLAGYRLCVLAHDRSFLDAMQLRPKLEHALWNGPLECRLLGWDI